ncbi:MAG TPA: SRPBCC family protein [Aridibacter sp.]|nr:SRPBCC family protein [Aridibacter sp.]
MKKILIGFAAIIAVGMIVLLILIGIAPSEFGVEREVVINKPKAETFAYLRILKNQDTWAPWSKKDPNMKHEYRGKDGEVGFVSAWDSDHEEVGSGEQEIKKIADGERIDYELRFLKPFESKADAWMTTEDAEGGKTKVKWGFKGNMPVPFNVMMLFMDMDAAISKDFDEGLASLKKELESQGK